MKKKLSTFLIATPILAAPALMAISCSGSSSTTSTDGNWQPSYESTDRLGKYDYAKFLSESTTGWDGSSATIDIRALQKLSTSFPFTSPEFNSSSLDKMFKDMVIDQPGVNPEVQLKNQINIYSKLVQQSAFPTSLNTSYYSYSFMTQYFDGSNDGLAPKNLDNPGFYHARPTKQNGDIKTSNEPWNKLFGNYDVTAPSNANDIEAIVKSIFAPGVSFPEGTKMQFNNSVTQASVKNSAQFYTHYLDEASNEYKELAPENKGWYLFQPVNQEGKGLQPESNSNAVARYIAPNSNRIVADDISVAHGNIMIKTANLVDISNSEAGQSGAVSEYENFGVYSEETPILEQARVSLMTPPIVIYVPVNYEIKFSGGQFVNPISKQPLDIFSTEALQFIEPDQPWNIMFDLGEWTPSQLKVGSEVYSPANFDQHMQIINSYGTSSNLLYETKKNAQYPIDGKFNEANLGVPNNFVKLYPSSDIRFRKVTGGNYENVGSSSPILSAISLVATATESNRDIMNVLPVIQGSANNAPDHNPSDNLFRISIDIDNDGLIDSTDKTYGFFGASADGKLLGPDSGFFLEKPLNKTDAHTKLTTNPDNPQGIVYDISQWGSFTDSEATTKWNSIPNVDVDPEPDYDLVRVIGDFESIQPINVNGVSITPLPKTNQDGNAVESYQGAGFQLLPIESVISNSSFIDAQSMGFVSYIFDSGPTPATTDDHVFRRKMYFDTDENGNPITVTGPAKEKYRLPQILSGFYREDATLKYTDYVTAVNAGPDAYNKYVMDHTLYSQSNVNARFIVPNESSDSKMFDGRFLQSNTITGSMKLHFEHGVNEMLLDRTRVSREEGIAVSPVPVVDPSTTWGTDQLNGVPVTFDLSNKFAQQVNFSGSIDNSPLELISQIDGRNINLFKPEIIANPFTVKLNWGSKQLGEIRNVSIASFGGIINDLKIMFDDAFGLSDITVVPLKLYNQSRIFDRTAYTPSDLQKLFWSTPTNPNYVSNIQNELNEPIGWFIGNEIDKMIHEDGFVPQEWGGV